MTMSKTTRMAPRRESHLPKYAIREIETREAFDSLIEVVWRSCSQPYRPEVFLMHPLIGPSPSDREASIQRDKDRLWEEHKSNSASHWICAVEVATNEVVGGVQWLVYEKNPFPPEKQAARMQCPWWPEGDVREFAEEVATQIYKPYMSWMPRPHLTINSMSVLPAHRGNGIGTRLMQWGTARADALHLECFTEASADLASHIYERCGFCYVMSLAINPRRCKDRCSVEGYAKLLHEYAPQTPMDYLWRPVGGKIEHGGPQAPWEISPRMRER